MERNLTLLGIYSVVMNMVIPLPVLVPFYRDELGLSFHDFLIGEAVFAAVVILLEIPSGWMADIWGRKWTITAASVFAVIGYLLITLANGFWQATLGQAVIGIAVSFHSGTLSAFLYDTLLSLKRQGEYRKREGLRHGLCLYAVAAGSVIGGITYQHDHFLPFYLEIALLVSGFSISLLMREPDRHKKAVERNAFHDMLVTMRYALHGHREIGGLILISAITFSSTKLFLWAQQPYYADLKIPESLYGFILAGAMLVGGLGGHFGHRLWRGWQGLDVIKFLFLAVVLICAVAGAALTHIGFATLTLGALLWGFGWPRIQETINHAVGSERRATILSTCSLMISLLFIPFSLLLGWIEERHDITLALQVQGFLVLLLGGFLYLWLKFRVRIPAQP